MKKYILSFVLLLVGMITIGASVLSMSDDGDITKKYITVKLKNGETVKILVDSVQELSFADTTIHIPQVKSVKFERNSLSLNEGEKYVLDYTLLEKEAIDTCKITISDPNVVSYKGKVVEALAPGTAIITITAAEGITDFCTVTVEEKKAPEPVAVKSLFLNYDSKDCDINGYEFYLRAYVLPDDASPASVKWATDNSNSVSITPSETNSLLCEVKPKNAGTAKVTVTVNDTLSASCVVNVAKATPAYVAVSSISVSPTTLDLKVGETSDLRYTISPNDATDRSASWKSYNENVATVSSSGVVTAVGEGTANIVVTSTDGSKTATCKVTVTEDKPVEKISVVDFSFNQNKYELFPTDQVKIVCNFIPSNATNQTVIFKSEDPSVATVDDYGKITAVASGETKITGTSVDGNFTDECTVKVIYVEADISTISASVLNSSSANIYVALSGDISADHVTEVGVQYLESDNFETENPRSVAGVINRSTNAFTASITGLQEATVYYYRAYIVVDGKTKFSGSRQIETKSAGDFPVAKEAVDLGLSVKWSSWNMGAKSLGEYGGYYSWGDATGQIKTISDYNSPAVDNIAGNANYDIATAMWGPEWRLPYASEFRELFDNCTEELIQDFFGDGSGVQVKKLTSKINGHYIYLPRGGYYRNSTSSSVGAQGFYWTCESSDLSTGTRKYFTFSTQGSNWESIQHGSYRNSIRPVSGEYQRPKTHEEQDAEEKALESAEAGDAVDLGLSVRWATCNVGATSKKSSDRGKYYAWAETQTKSDYTLATYSHKDYSYDTEGNVSVSYKYIGDDFSGNSEYDVARALWLGKWRVPTDDEFAELINKCDWTWTSVDGVNGYKVTGPSGNSIFLPAGGNQTGKDVMQEGEKGFYWTSTLYSNQRNPQYNVQAWYISFIQASGKDGINDTYFDRCVGRCIRPVKEYLIYK